MKISKEEAENNNFSLQLEAAASDRDLLLQVCLSKSWGGLEMVALETAFRYSQRGIPCITACIADSRLQQELADKKLPYLTIRARKYFAPFGTLQLRRILRKFQISRVLIQQLSDLWVLMPAVFGMPQVELIGVSHSFLQVDKKDFWHRRIYRRLNRLVCLTELQRKNLLQHLAIDETKISVVPNSVDLRRFFPERRKDSVRNSLGVEHNEVLIGVVSRLDRLKGQKEAVEAAALMKSWGLAFKLVLVGEDTINTPGTGCELRARVQEKNLQDQVIFAGFRSDIEAVVASLDILLVPSKAETFGRVLLEAMASRVPTIGTAAGGIPDIISNGHDGLLVPEGDIRLLAIAMQKLIADSQLRQTIATNGLQKAIQQYAMEEVEKKMDTVVFHHPLPSFASQNSPFQLSVQ
jgi:D-inositol-3-phosphate glycosyltransferase